MYLQILPEEISLTAQVMVQTSQNLGNECLTYPVHLNLKAVRRPSLVILDSPPHLTEYTSNSGLPVRVRVTLLNMLLDESPNNILQTESVRMYLECEYFIMALAVLSFFSYYVTLPLLYCVEESTQTDLCDILPKLYDDLVNGNTDTLSRFVALRKHLDVPTLSSELERGLLLQKFMTQQN